uniref:Translation initiation factor IF-2, chloroplastic n=1 Tax=Rhodymenia pseudopalmata TaxID=31502 RepID=A0A1C9C7G1_RHOPU|nr:translation initiation factor 2 [Rhodymenia pseudopalmata]AOM64310.1 translation initiation factor 2 [Rhodymenia pseudopalmata]
MMKHTKYNSNTFCYNSTRLLSSYRCLSKDKYEELLLLKDPKFIYVLNILAENSSTKYEPIVSSNRSFSPVEDENIKLFPSKYDKKTRPNTKLETDIDTRKNRIKLKKKTRNKISLDKEDLFVANNTTHVLNDDSFDKSLIRQSKSSKNKKKNKLKQNLLNDTIISDINNVSNLHVDKKILIDNPMTIQELSADLKIPEAEIITWLFLKGISVTVNQAVDVSIATQIATHYSFEVINSPKTTSLPNKKSKAVDQLINYSSRPPVVTVFGHIDHGKTTLLDVIRSADTVNLEAGGITQAMAGYEVNWRYNSSEVKLVFLDTPGHEAFVGMRSRGARVTDVALLVVAADDGLKPQAIEAISHIRSNHLPCIVAINKIDKKHANVLKIREELAKYDLLDVSRGGSTPIVEISALKMLNIDILLSNICQFSKAHCFKADAKKLAQGTILEAYLDKTKGPIANILVQDGTLFVGNIISSSSAYGRVKALIDHKGLKVNSAKPSSIIQVWGFSSVPQAGSEFKVLKNEKEAKQVLNRSAHLQKKDNFFKSLNTRIGLDFYDKNIEVCIKQINLIIKTDTQGSIEALVHSFSQIPQDKVQLNILSANSGSVTGTDIDLALTSGSMIVAFNVNISIGIHNIIKKSGVDFHNFTIIYDLLDFIRSYMLNLVEPEYDQVLIGTAFVQTVFEVNKGSVAGCFVDQGKLQKHSSISVFRDDKVIYTGILDSLKRVKDDVDEVVCANECGIMCYSYHLWQKGDTIKAYKMNEKKKTL